MRRLLVLALGASLAWGLVGCDGDGSDGDTSGEDGATASLAGTWVGEMDCSDENGWMELEIDMDLEDIGDGEFEGPFEGDGDGTFSGDTYPIRIEANVQLELTDDAGGEQTITSLWSDCEIWAGDEYGEEDCSYGNDWTWDGADELSMETDDCETVVNR